MPKCSMLFLMPVAMLDYYPGSTRENPLQAIEAVAALRWGLGMILQTVCRQVS